MNTKKKKNRIILCICSIFLLVASIFSFIPLTKQSKFVYADTVTSDYSFSGSNISSKTTFNRGLFSYNLCPVNYINSNTIEYVYFSNPLPSGSYTLSAIVSSDSPDEQCLVEVYNRGYWVTQFKISKSNTREVAHRTISSDFDELRFYAGTNNFEFNFSFTDILLVSGDSDLPYVPYENSTYLNYEFDFYSSYRETLGYTMTGHLNVNDNSEYRLAFSFDDATTPSPVANNENFFYQDASRKYYVQYSLFCKYNNSDILDDSYNFCLYTLFDHSVDTTYPYFVSNVSYIVIGSYLDSSSYFRNTYTYSPGISTNTGFDIFTSKYNFISYVDYNGNNFNIFIPLDSVNEYEYFNYRTYYLDSINDTVTQSVFNQGYNSGYKDGENVGNQNGFTNGYNIGKNDGYNLGYNTALNNDKYSFVSLISSVIDVPVKAFTSLFNFEILGVNLSGFFLGLLTCCIVIGVIRLIL